MIIMALKKEILEILACPKCKGGLKLEKQKLICKKCRLRYKIMDNDIPDMLIEHAEKF